MVIITRPYWTSAVILNAYAAVTVAAESAMPTFWTIYMPHAAFNLSVLRAGMRTRQKAICEGVRMARSSGACCRDVPVNPLAYCRSRKGYCKAVDEAEGGDKGERSTSQIEKSLHDSCRYSASSQLSAGSTAVAL